MGRRGAIGRDDGGGKVVHEAGIEREDGAGGAEAMAAADEIAHGNAFAANTEAQHEAAHFWHRLRYAGAEEILIGDREDALPGLRTEGGDGICVPRIEEVEPLGVEVCASTQGFVGMSTEDETPAAVSRLHGLVGCGFDDLSFIESRACGAIDA